MSPESLQAREHVAILRQLHLGLGSGGLGTHGEDVEDEGGAVEDFHLKLVLDVAYLLGGQLIIEDDHTDLTVFLFFVLDVLLDFLQLTLTHVRGLVGSHHLLGESLHGDGTGGIGEKFQLVEIFLGLGLVLLLGHQTHEDGGLCLDF